MRRLLIALLLILTATAAAQDKERDIEKFFLGYVELLKSGDYPEAQNRWALIDRTIADQLRLQFAGEPMKLELGSPLWANIGALRSDAATIKIDTVRFSRDFARINYTITNGKAAYEGRAYAVAQSVLQPSLVSPTHVYCEAWEEARSTYFRVRFRDPSLFEQSNLEKLDNFVHRTAVQLGISNERLVILETLKANIFLCESYGEVEQITGHLALGHYEQSMDAIISKYLPPYNEVAQFLVSYALKEPPAHTHPFFRYGTATFLAGRWGRSEPVLAMIGKYLFDNQLAPLEPLMTVDSFATFEANPDFAYPIAGMFCEFLWSKLGRDSYLQLYREMSGSAEKVRAITLDQFKSTVAAAAKVEWASLDSDFKSWIKARGRTGIRPGARIVGQPIFESGVASMLVRIYEDSASYNFVVAPKNGPVEGAVLLSSMAETPFKSFLFEEQFPDTTYKNCRYGVLFSAAEIGAYDYYSNEITGKYIVGLSGDEPIANAEGTEYRFNVDKNLLQGFRMYLARLRERR